jgi:hypothetical protein
MSDSAKLSSGSTCQWSRLAMVFSKAKRCRKWKEIKRNEQNEQKMKRHEKKEKK